MFDGGALGALPGDQELELRALPLRSPECIDEHVVTLARNQARRDSHRHVSVCEPEVGASSSSIGAIRDPGLCIDAVIDDSDAVGRCEPG